MQELEQENAALKKGEAPESVELTQAELDELRDNYPAQYKVAVLAKQANDTLREQQSSRQQQSDGFQPRIAPPEVQEFIDQVPDLLTWQHDEKSQDKFARAVQYDEALILDPDWKDKPVAERYAEAARRTKAAFGIADAPAPSAATPAAPRTDPALALANAPVQGPKGISDFPGGAPGNAPTLDYRKMSDADIMASLQPEP